MRMGAHTSTPLHYAQCERVFECAQLDETGDAMVTKKTITKTKPAAAKAGTVKATPAKTAKVKSPAKPVAAKPKAAPKQKVASKPHAKLKSPATEPTAKRDDMQIGGRLKHARLLAGIRMRELAEKVGCTESMISKLESGRVVPSLPMLQRLVDALDRDLASFFGSDPNSPGIIQRAGERSIAYTDPIRKGTGISYERLVPFGAGNLLECNIHVIEPDGAKQDPITHQGETVGYVVEGQLELTVETTLYKLAVGDSFFFKNHLTNSYRNPGPGVTRVLWVNTPQVH
ncbi:MAG: putative HTH-type transcriptional regulator [Rhodocyclales bacterium]|nr:putative HTH-type transcriptional regulator [Rhodocyclales bacterium]